MSPTGEQFVHHDHFSRWVQAEEFQYSCKTRSNNWDISAAQTSFIHEKNNDFNHVMEGKSGRYFGVKRIGDM